MNLHLLRVFFTVIEHCGFSRAAEVLCVSQSAVSKAVRELEHQLGLALIERGSGKGAGVRTTDSGQALYQHARAIFALERVASEEVRDRVDLLQGRLRLGASTTIAGYWLPAAIARFTRAFPAIGTELMVGNTQAIAQAVIDCRVDLALVEGTVDDPRIVASVWREEPLRIVAAHGSALAGVRKPGIAALNAQTWLVRESGSGTRQVSERLLRAHGVQPRHTIEVGSNEAIARCVAEGAGLAMLPAVVVEELVAIGRIAVVAVAGQQALLRPLYRLQLANRPRSPALDAFLGMLDGVPPAADATAPTPATRRRSRSRVR